MSQGPQGQSRAIKIFQKYYIFGQFSVHVFKICSTFWHVEYHTSNDRMMWICRKFFEYFWLIFEYIWSIYFLNVISQHCNIGSRLQVKAWCCQAASHYLNQCWPRSMLLYGATGPQWVKQQQQCFFVFVEHLNTLCCINIGGFSGSRLFAGHLSLSTPYGGHKCLVGQKL